MVNIEDAAAPFAQAFFAYVGPFPEKYSLHDMKISFTYRNAGIYQFGLAVYNLE